jgi:hypothetical protein
MINCSASSKNSGSFAPLNVTVRIGVFFDGTGNNRVNSQVGADCQAMAEIYNFTHIKECGGRHSDPNSSYSNDLTNIAQLAELYLHRPKASNGGEGFKVYHSVYVSGVGTTSGGRDSLPGQGFGRGSTGVVAKAFNGIKKINRVLDEFDAHNPGCVIAALELDIFGFSRGAASARHMANEVLKQNRGALGPILNHYKLPLAPDFSWSNNSVRLKVIGLFDTVAAVGGVSDFGNVRDAVNRKVNLFLPPGCAEQVIHLVAGDEHRRNFALNSVTPDWGREIVLPGSHSDIGGGYHPQSIEKVALTRPRRSRVPAHIPYENTDAWLQTQAEMEELNVHRWLDPQDQTATVGLECVERRSQYSFGMKTVLASVRLVRRVFGYLSRVYLRVMHVLACEEGVPFRPIPDTPDFCLPPELRGIATKLVDYARGEGNSLSKDELQILYQRYIHCSAHWNRPLSTRGVFADSLFVHAPATGGRSRYPNASQPGYPH